MRQRHQDSPPRQRRSGYGFVNNSQNQNRNGNKKVKKANEPYLHILKKDRQNEQLYQQGRIIFKWQPYPIQLNYMKHVLTTLENKLNGLVQAPTGSGKTLCLLNSVFGWLTNLEEQEIPLQYPRKVIYTSRAHSQLEQIKKQLEKTWYRPNMVVFGGRKKMCCNPNVNTNTPDLEDATIEQRCHKAVQYRNLQFAIQQLQKESKNKQMSLEQMMKSEQQAKLQLEQKVKIKDMACPYYIKFNDRSRHSYPIFRQLESQAITINDQYNKCKASTPPICPYYYPSTVKNKGDLIVMPYNYVLNRNILARNRNLIENSILIFDEGHNITDCAREGLTVKLTQSFLKSVADQLKKSLKKLESKFKSKNEATDQLDGSEQEELGLFKQTPKIRLGLDPQKVEIEIVECIQIVNNMATAFKKYEQQHIDSQENQSHNHSSHGRNRRMRNQNQTLVDRGQNGENIIKNMIKIIFGEQVDVSKTSREDESSPFNKYIDRLVSLHNKSEKIFDQISTLSDSKYIPFTIHKFADTINDIGNILYHEELLYDYGLFFQWHKKKQSHSLELKLCCFNPKLMFDEIQKCSPMSIIITSGTLSPMDTWEDQTGLPFNILANNREHVILPKQCRTLFIPKYRGKPAYYSTGQNGISVPYNCKIALEAIQKICNKTPGGVLVILPSTAWVSQMKNAIEVTSIKKKTFFEENKDPLYKNLQRFQEIYKQACESDRGAILFTKCRGLVTEGIDFPNDLCRAVVVVGYPQPNTKKPTLRGKMNYFDRCKKDGKSKMNGEQWLEKDIIRAVNQGIGRVIRHKDDYGMIFMLDNRYTWSKYKKDIAGWALRNEDTISHDQIQSECEKFFKMHRGSVKMQVKLEVSTH